MTDMSKREVERILQHASGYLELAGLVLEGDAPPPPHAATLLRRCLAEVTSLPEAIRFRGAASLFEGEALRALGEHAAALVPLTRAAEARPGRLEPWLGLGWCFKRLGCLDEAIGALTRGLEASPEQPILLYNLSCYHALAGNVAAAIDHLSRAIALDVRFRDLTEAERDFDAIRSDPRFVAATCTTA